MAASRSTSGPERCGEQTLQFKKVRANFVDIVKALEANKEAEKSLRRYLVQVGWIPHSQNMTVDDNMAVVMDRISRNVEEYPKFMEILGKIVGLDQIKKAIEETTCKWYISVLLCVCCVLDGYVIIFYVLQFRLKKHI